MGEKLKSKRIEAVRFVSVCDDSPDLSHLGKYTDKPKDWAIVRRDRDYLINLRAKPQECSKCGAPTKREEDEDGYENAVCPKCGRHDPIEEYEIGPQYGGECRFFVPYAAGAPAPWDAEHQKYGLEDWERMEAYERQEWGMRGYFAEASIVVAGTCQQIRSGGLYGVESDSEEGYVTDHIQPEELAQLREALEALGFEGAEIDRAFANVKQVDR